MRKKKKKLAKFTSSSMHLRLWLSFIAIFLLHSAANMIPFHVPSRINKIESSKSFRLTFCVCSVSWIGFTHQILYNNWFLLYGSTFIGYAKKSRKKTMYYFDKDLSKRFLGKSFFFSYGKVSDAIKLM